jgi:hypothetical protein
MTPVSRRELPTKEKENIEGILISELSKITDPGTFESLTNVLLSPSEKLMLAKRMAVFVMTENKAPDTQIAKAMNLTTVTVAKLRYAYLFSKEKKNPIVDTAQNPKLWEILKPLLKKFLVEYAIPAAGGRAPK